MIEVRRARPLLGTRVEVIVDAFERRAALAAAGAALDEVERIQRLLSFHDPQSELSRVHREAHLREVTVDRATARVLRLAAALWRASGGAFDPAVAPRLVDAGLLPRPLDSVRPAGSASLAALECRGCCRVRFKEPLWLDFGGLAKGYAVDRAVAVLRRAGVVGGCVEAGGDLRVFGSRLRRIAVRPDHRHLATVGLRDASIATSSTWAGGSRGPGAVRHLVDSRGGAMPEPDRAVAVIAGRCSLADGLTKVVLLDPVGAESLLRRCGARAILFEHATARMLPELAASPVRRTA